MLDLSVQEARQGLHEKLRIVEPRIVSAARLDGQVLTILEIGDDHAATLAATRLVVVRREVRGVMTSSRRNGRGRSVGVAELERGQPRDDRRGGYRDRTPSPAHGPMCSAARLRVAWMASPASIGENRWMRCCHVGSLTNMATTGDP